MSPRPLARAGDTDLAEVGGKARALGLLIGAGFPVPDGFVVSPDESVDTAALAPHLERLGNTTFAVRSSGADEDSAESSLAGRYRSRLDVDAGSVPAAIAEVRESGRLADGVSIPVVIQRMVHPVCSGVAFTADPITGDRDTTLITGTGGLADRLVSGEVAGDEWQVIGGRAKRTRKAEGVLDRRLALRVATAAGEIADKFGTPQDVEWAWDGAALWIVQARPMTSLPEHVSWEPSAPGIYQRSLRFGEWIPQPVTPLFESWLLPTMEQRVHHALSEHIGQVAPKPHHVIVNGWYYYSLNWLPVPGVAFWRNFFSIVPRLGRDWRKAAAMFPQSVRFGYQQFEDEWRRTIQPRYRSAVTSARSAIDDLDPAGLVRLIDDLADEAGRYFGSITTVAGSGYKFEQQLAMFWTKHLRDEVGENHVVALQGLDLPASIDETPRLESLDWWVAPMRPQPTPRNAAVAARRDEAVRRAEQVLAGSPRRLRKFRRLLADAQRLVPIREEQLAELSLPWPIMRDALTRLGHVLADNGSIDTADDVYFLTRAELDPALAAPGDLRATVAGRREARQRACRLVAPLWVGPVPPTVRFMFDFSNRVMGAVRSETAVVTGIPSSPGRATGRVRVVTDSSQFADFEAGEILVAPLTAPAWTELFDRAAAVVTDVGSALAHASIIAREYGIPAVVGCGDATARLRDGQMVMVDGSAGNVELVSA
jgi:rifampicin phosphotransferase